MENEEKKCWACHGTGVILSESSSLDGGSHEEEVPCTYCKAYVLEKNYEVYTDRNWR